MEIITLKKSKTQKKANMLNFNNKINNLMLLSFSLSLSFIGHCI